MHKILKNTHKESNINILKARDYYFDKARFINNFLRRICLHGSIALFVAGVLMITIFRLSGQAALAEWLEQNLDLMVGCVAIVAFIVDFYFEHKVDELLSKSNALRELYDVKVLDITANEFYYCYTDQEISGFLETAKYVKDSNKYEVWYREIFAKENFSNVICAMMDNVIYTYYVYAENTKQHLTRLLVTLGLFALYSGAYIIGDFSFLVVSPFVLFLAIFDYIKELVDSFVVSKDLVAKNKELKDYVILRSEELLAREDKGMILRCIQDVIINNRENSLFISKSVRNKFLDNDCPFYKELDAVKQIFLGDDVEKPQYAKEFEIGTVEDENQTVDFEMIHTELRGMLQDVKACLDKHQLSFMLDGGTLIGTMRRSNHQRFLEWDDDIDLVVKSCDVEEVKKVIASDLGDTYEIQDYYNEEAYSPRLATFRIRQKNSVSRVSEKDSELYELYERQGLFIDVYAYSPILVNTKVDALYRRLLIHPLNRKIRKAETEWKIGGQPEKAFAKFQCLKAKYIKRANWYLQHACNEEYVAYEPFYIYHLNQVGPYIKTEDLFGEKTEAMFEGANYEVPSNCDAVLTAYYGPKWEQSPYATLEDIRIDGKLFYSKAAFDATCYKHLKRVSIYEKNSEK